MSLLDNRLDLGKKKKECISFLKSVKNYILKIGLEFIYGWHLMMYLGQPSYIYTCTWYYMLHDII